MNEEDRPCRGVCPLLLYSDRSYKARRVNLLLNSRLKPSTWRGRGAVSRREEDRSPALRVGR